ncbi:hypothetical protein [Pseudomonas kitaguniensis]|uniref:hypothetical protein n=1 Tax=Pseudomonas kitaguniensis TaxID=2607908 RepID=UPI001562BDB4|nr:hypothetical protein [Pseudomonas kitaguniensis]
MAIILVQEMGAITSLLLQHHVFFKIRMIEASRRLEVVQRKAVSAANKTGQVNEREIF